MILHSKIEGTGMPLLILHGFLGMLDNWKTLASQYVNLGFEVHAIDLRNHGKSFHSLVFNYTIMSEDIVNYCKHYNLQKISIIGHSMGGKVVMQLVSNQPNLIEKAIVADIGPKYYAPHHQKIIASLQAVNFTEKPSRSQVEATIANFIPDYGTRQFLMKNVYWQTPEQLGFRFNLAAFENQIDEIGKALPFDVNYINPILFLRGNLSDYILNADFEIIFHHFPKAEIKTIPNAGHWLHADNPKAFFEMSSAFLIG